METIALVVLVGLPIWTVVASQAALTLIRAIEFTYKTEE